MAYKDLVSKLGSNAKALRLAVGLMGLVAAGKLDAQVLNSSVEVKDSNGNVVTGNLQAGQTYLVYGNLTNLLNNQSLSFGSIKEALKLTFGNGMNSTDATFGYTLSPTPAGTPPTDLDLFAGATMASAPSTSFSYDSPNTTFNFIRTIDTGLIPTLAQNETKSVVSFYFTPNSSLTGGSVNFDYTPGSTQMFDGGFDEYGSTIHSGNYISFSSSNFNITAVPEPSTYALIAGGLALAGAAAWRRRNRVKSTETGKTDYVEKDDAIDVESTRIE